MEQPRQGEVRPEQAVWDRGLGSPRAQTPLASPPSPRGRRLAEARPWGGVTYLPSRGYGGSRGDRKQI